MDQDRFDLCRRWLISAYSRIDTRTRSLYYNGNFLKIVSQELMWPFDLSATFMLYKPIHNVDGFELIYDIIPERDGNELLNKELKRNDIHKFNIVKKYKLINAYNYYKSFINDNINNISFDIVIPVDIKYISTVFSHKNIEIMSKIFIPLIIKSCNNLINNKYEFVCDPFAYHLHGKKCNDNNCMYQLIGVIECYSQLTKELIDQVIGDGSSEGGHFFRKDSFLGQISYLFSKQEGLLCCGKEDRESPGVRQSSCLTSLSPCGTGQSERMGSNFRDRIKPEEVIKQLFSKCQAIFPREPTIKIAYLRYDSNQNTFQPKEVTFIGSPQTDAGFRVARKAWLESRRNIATGSTSKHNLDDLLEGQWGDFLNNMPSKIAGYSYQLDKEERLFLTENDEKLFDLPFFIFMPMLYHGQLLGCLMINFQPPGERIVDKKVLFQSSWGWEEIKQFLDFSYDIAAEFGPLLFHSLKLDFIAGIVQRYFENEEENIHKTIINNIYGMLNISLAAYWEFKEDNVTFNEHPDFIWEFSGRKRALRESGEELGDSKLTGEGSKTKLTVNREVIIDSFQNNNIKIINLVIDLESSTFNFPEGYSTNASIAENIIRLKTALIIPIKDDGLKKAGLSEGVYVFFFERHEDNVLCRYADEIAQEISGFFNIILLGESRKKSERQRQELESINRRLQEVQEKAEELSRILNNQVINLANRIITITRAECNLDLNKLRQMFQSPTITLREKGSDSQDFDLMSSHDFIEDNEKFRSWLGYALFNLVGGSPPEGTRNRELFQAACNYSTELISGDNDILNRGLKKFIEVLANEDTIREKNKIFTLLKNLIHTPGKPNTLTPTYTLAYRFLLQTEDLKFNIFIKENDTGKLHEINLSNFTELTFIETLKNLFFPSISGISHSEWFNPLVSLVTKPFSYLHNKGFFVRKVIIANNRVECMLEKDCDKKGSLEEIIEQKRKVEKYYCELGNNKKQNILYYYKGNYRENLARLIFLKNISDNKIDFAIDAIEKKFILSINTNQKEYAIDRNKYLNRDYSSKQPVVLYGFNSSGRDWKMCFGREVEEISDIDQLLGEATYRRKPALVMLHVSKSNQQIEQAWVEEQWQKLNADLKKHLLWLVVRGAKGFIAEAEDDSQVHFYLTALSAENLRQPVVTACFRRFLRDLETREHSFESPDWKLLYPENNIVSELVVILGLAIAFDGDLPLKDSYPEINTIDVRKAYEQYEVMGKLMGAKSVLSINDLASLPNRLPQEQEVKKVFDELQKILDPQCS